MILQPESGRSKAVQLQPPSHMVPPEDTREPMQGCLGELTGEQRPLSETSSQSSPLLEASAISQTPPEPPSINLERPNPKRFHTGEPANLSGNGIEPPVSGLVPVTMLKVSAEEDTEFKQFVDANGDEDNEDSLYEQVAMRTSDGHSSPVVSPASYSTNDHPVSIQSDTRAEIADRELLETEESSLKQPPPIPRYQPQVIASEPHCAGPTIELRFLVRRREAGALIGKRGSYIKRLRETFRSSMFSIPDTGNGPERVVCIATNERSLDAILTDLTQLLMEKSPENDDQLELKLLIHSSHAGSIIGIGGQSIKKLRNESKAAIKIYEMCCPLSNERVCAIKAKPHVAVNTIQLIQSILNENPIKGTIKPYDALHFDLSLSDKYGGYFPDEPIEMMSNHYHYEPLTAAYKRPHFHENGNGAYLPKGHYSIWRSADYREPTCDLHEAHEPLVGVANADGLQLACQHRAAMGNQTIGAPRLPGKSASVPGASTPGDTTTNKATQHEPNDGSGDCDEQQVPRKTNPPTTSHYAAPPNLAGRFHPYAPPMSGHAGNFAACNLFQMQRRQLSPMMDGSASCGGLPQLVHPYGNLMQLPRGSGRCRRTPADDFSNATERCRHGVRPCLCMFLPIPNVLPAGPFVQVTDFGNAVSRGGLSGAGGSKSFRYYSRSPPDGVHRKK